MGVCAALSITACGSRLTAPGASNALPVEPASTISPLSPTAEGTSPEPPGLASSEGATLPQINDFLRKELGAVGTQRYEFLRSLCPVAFRRDKNQLRVGCRACPPFDAAPPDGTAPEVGFEGEDFFELESLTTGSFTQAGADEAAVVFSGCEAAADTGDGTLLAERGADGVWVQESYKTGLHPDSCLTFRRPDGRDLLVCRRTVQNEGIGRDDLWVQDFGNKDGQSDKAGLTNLLSLEDDAVAVCWALESKPSPVAADLVTTGRIDSFDLLPTDGDRPAALVVRAHASRKKPTKAYIARCRDWLAEKARANPRYIDVKTALHPPALRLLFLWTDAGFEPDAATRSILSKLAPASP